MSPFIRPATIRHAARLLALSIFCLMLGIYSSTMSTQPDILDGEVEFQTTSSLVRSQSLALGGTPESDAIAELGFNCTSGVGERADEKFSWFGVGQAFVGVPFYMLGTALGRVFPSIEQRNALDKLEGFASLNGPRFYGLPANTDRITLVREDWTAPTSLPFGELTVIPLRAGETLRWRLLEESK